MNDRRGFYRKNLHPLYQVYYDSLCGVLGDSWQPTCGLRSFDTQTALYAQGRTAPGPRVTNAVAGMSFHQYGLASDWDNFPGGLYTPLKADDPKWQEYIDACQKVGLDNISWEKPHNQLRIHVSIGELFAAYKQGGITAVNVLLSKEPGAKPPAQH